MACIIQFINNLRNRLENQTSRNESNSDNSHLPINNANWGLPKSKYLFWYGNGASV